ncbi:thioredoxin H4-2-like [Ipomoea triloba]|uniref:thioredoxin H4-2-like n=1 Tax=Ipomoea triloba TaxID=35885 RepID=UPI00125D5C2B|nr:thioredoxin H4-2-like [Ipomoea triloba]
MGQCWTRLCGQGNEEHTSGSAELGGGNVHLVTTIEDWDENISEANKDDKIVIVNFSASWCNHSRNAAPIYRQLADKHTSFMFITVDVDELGEFSSSWDIKATPTFFFLKDGRQLDTLVGVEELELQKKLKAVAEQKE